MDLTVFTKKIPQKKEKIHAVPCIYLSLKFDASSGLLLQQLQPGASWKSNLAISSRTSGRG
jgi:hypothetical protein